MLLFVILNAFLELVLAVHTQIYTMLPPLLGNIRPAKQNTQQPAKKTNINRGWERKDDSIKTCSILKHFYFKPIKRYKG